MTAIYYDTEFLETGSSIDLISIGMVREDGAEYYAINSEMPFGPISRHAWLMQHVMPSLPVRTGHSEPWDLAHSDFQHVKPRQQIADEVRTFIQASADPQLWAWYGAFDHVVLSWLWGPMVQHPIGVPMWTNDLRQECERLGNPRLPEQPAGEHNALEDARHNLVRAQALAEAATAPAPPRRGDAVAVWLKAQRDQHPRPSHAWFMADCILDTYRLHADTRTPLGEHVCEQHCDCDEAMPTGLGVSDGGES